MRGERVAVIGAGMGGLVAALELAARGLEVIVLERAAEPGGKMREIEIGGARLDAGPTVFTMRWVFEELFAAVGTTLAEHVRLLPVDILARHAWSEHERLDLYADADRSAEAIAAFAGFAEARRYRQFCAHAQRTYQTLTQSFIRAARPSPGALVRAVGLRGLGDLWRTKPFDTLWRALGEYFRDPRLHQLFGRYATYCGSSPFLAPATLMLVAHVERDGIWLVEGGMHRIASALAQLAAVRGATFRYRSEVNEVIVSSGRARGVKLTSGEAIQADAVIVNADVAALTRGLLGSAAARAVPSTPHAQRSLSALTWTLVAQTEGFPLLRHTVFFSHDYESEFNDIFRHARLPAAPTAYVCAQDRDNHDGASFTCPERLFCLVNAPPTGDTHSFERAEIARCTERTFGLLARCGLRIQRRDEAIAVTTPADFERLFPATGGALYGRATHGWKASFSRPLARSRIANLYLAGGSTHPGPGVPMAALSGRLAAATLIQDLVSTRR